MQIKKRASKIVLYVKKTDFDNVHRLQEVQILTTASYRCLGATRSFSSSRSRVHYLHHLDHTKTTPGQLMSEINGKGGVFLSKALTDASRRRIPQSHGSSRCVTTSYLDVPR